LILLQTNHNHLWNVTRGSTWSDLSLGDQCGRLAITMHSMWARIGDESILDEATSKHALKEKWTVKLNFKVNQIRWYLQISKTDQRGTSVKPCRNDMPIMTINTMVMWYLNWMMATARRNSLHFHFDPYNISSKSMRWVVSFIRSEIMTSQRRQISSWYRGCLYLVLCVGFFICIRRYGKWNAAVVLMSFQYFHETVDAYNSGCTCNGIWWHTNVCSINLRKMYTCIACWSHRTYGLFFDGCWVCYCSSFDQSDSCCVSSVIISLHHE